MNRFGYSLFAACLSIGMGLSAMSANAAQPLLPLASAAASQDADAVQRVQYYDYRGDRRYWRHQRYWRHHHPRYRPYYRYYRHWGPPPRAYRGGTRMCAGAITVTGPTAPMTTPTSPITGRGASAIRLICETNKAPDDPGLCFQAAVQSGDVGTDRGCNQANCNGDHHAIDARLVEQNGES